MWEKWEEAANKGNRDLEAGSETGFLLQLSVGLWGRGTGRWVEVQAAS